MTHSEIALQLVAFHPGYWTELHDHCGVFLSDSGLVASTRSGKVRLLKGSRRGRYVTISAMQKGPYLHQEMCRVFYGPRPLGAQVRHLDGDIFNNAYSNLRWGTPKENSSDKIAHGTTGAGAANSMAKLSQSAVDQMRRLRAETGKPYQQIAKQFGVSTMTAFRAVRGQSWK